jgi:serine/threonine-protein kinase HipA
MERRDLALTVGRFGRTASIYNIISECARFGVTPEAAIKEIDAIVGVIRGWREHFHECGVPPQDIDYIAPAFLPPCFFYEERMQGV